MLDHATVLKLGAAVPGEVDVGCDFSLSLTVACPAGCDLTGAPFKITDSESVIASGELPGPAGTDSSSVELRLRAPNHVGRFEWNLVLPDHVVDGVVHQEVSLAFAFVAKPHSTSVAFWDNPSPVVVGQTFQVRVGVRCNVTCGLAGKAIEICDENGAVVASGALGDAVWPGTTALYWTSVDVPAPAREGRFSWLARFSASDTSLAHSAVASELTFTTVKPPEHDVLVRVVQKDTQLPIGNAYVRLGVYRRPTDETGVAAFAVPGGEHNLSVWKSGYEAPARTINVNKTEDVQIEAVLLPVEDPDAYWQG